MLGLTLVICRNKEGKYLAVKESKNRGWWVPGGRVDPPESHAQAGVRETIEEAGIHVELKGILRTEFNICSQYYQRLKVVYYAEPIDENQKPKSRPDKGKCKG
jgi:8-oxo-dGTP pyrophosphatase MutT (NUDIX family)